MNRFTLEELDRIVNGGLIVSCQPIVNGPLDKDDMVTAMGLACVAGGAKALRIQGAQRVQKMRRATDVPIIGVVKRDIDNFDVRITPTLEDISDLVAAGADIVAFDATNRPRPISREALVDFIITNDCFAMADCACMDDVVFSLDLDVDFIGTTLAGYTGPDTPDKPDYEFLANATQVAPRVIAEGRYNTTVRAKEALRLGAWGVTIGTALTRLETMTSWFANSLSHTSSAGDNLEKFSFKQKKHLTGL